jgi:hypothetical protein|nr:MAG TPA: hypothetical protein [Caudoviricetes sp.]
MILNMLNPETIIPLQLITSTRVITPSKPSTNAVYPKDSNIDGYTSVTVKGDSKLIASNIRANTTIFGVRGSY